MGKIKHFFKILGLRLSIIKDFIGFLWSVKLWWSIPIFVILILLMGLIAFGGHTGIAPFIYALF